MNSTYLNVIICKCLDSIQIIENDQQGEAHVEVLKYFSFTFKRHLRDISYCDHYDYSKFQNDYMVCF